MDCCETSHGNSAQVIHINNCIRKIFLLSRNVITSTSFMDNRRLPCYHWNTWFRWLILGFFSLFMVLPAFLLLLLSQWGGGACILHSVRVGIWIGLSLLVQSRTVWSHPPPLGPHLVMTVNYDSWKNSGLNDISSSGDVQIDTNLVVTAFSARNREEECGSSVLQRIQYLQQCYSY